MLGIGNLLFGKKVIVDTQIGTFKARIKKNSSKQTTWTLDATSKTENTALFILLVGNEKGPSDNQIETVQFIRNNMESIKAQIVAIIASDKDLKREFQDQKITDFHLSYIGSLKESNVNFELSFERKKDDGYLGATLKDQKITEVNL
ncbi:hypothetical protein [Kordia sp.]|uniref:hypothetical protein n=1 Tax=Kordia sp. TaxID=1965332 RepID=UPI003D2DE025